MRPYKIARITILKNIFPNIQWLFIIIAILIWLYCWYLFVITVFICW